MLGSGEVESTMLRKRSRSAGVVVRPELPPAAPAVSPNASVNATAFEVPASLPLLTEGGLPPCTCSCSKHGESQVTLLLARFSYYRTYINVSAVSQHRSLCHKHLLVSAIALPASCVE